jgi:hypothetical protein
MSDRERVSDERLRELETLAEVKVGTRHIYRDVGLAAAELLEVRKVLAAELAAVRRPRDLAAELLDARDRIERAAEACNVVLPHGWSWDFAQRVRAILLGPSGLTAYWSALREVCSLHPRVLQPCPMCREAGK